MWFRSSPPRITIGSRGPFVGPLDLHLWQYSLPLHKLDTHLYVVGRSGKGKSKFLEGFLWQLINLDQGCGLIDPHGDLASNLLKLLATSPNGRYPEPWLSYPKNRDKIIYVEPGREAYTIPMNVLAGPDKPYTKAMNVIEAFQRTWSQSLGEAPQFKNVTLHGLLLLIEQNLTLVELPRLFMDKSFRDSLLDRSQNKDVIAFFEQRFDQWGREQVLRIESLLNKVTALTLNGPLRAMLGAKENRINLREIMDSGRILIVNLGTCDQETRDLLGSLLTVGLEQAAKSRVTMEEEDRQPWYCVLDEFQRFVANEGSAQVLAHMLSEARKMGLRLCLAHQGWHQLNNAQLEGALEQAQVKVIFGSGAKTSQVLAEELFLSNPRQIKHEVEDLVAQQRTHPHFESILEQRELFMQRIRTQRRREILFSPPESQHLIRLRTLTVPQPIYSPTQLNNLKTALLEANGHLVTSSSGSVASATSSETNPVNKPKLPTASGIIS